MKLLFQKYDTDGNGVMDASELGNFIKKDLGYKISEEELQKVLGVLDKDGSGQLEFEEVCKWWSDQLGS
jgi:Ca2+-binding EF-hand superfamily protein